MLSIVFALLLLRTITSIASRSSTVVGTAITSQELGKANFSIDLLHALIVGLCSAFGSEDDVL